MKKGRRFKKDEEKSLLALVLGLIPGLGHLYLKNFDDLFYIAEGLYFYLSLQHFLQ